MKFRKNDVVICMKDVYRYSELQYAPKKVMSQGDLGLITWSTPLENDKKNCYMMLDIQRPEKSIVAVSDFNKFEKIGEL